MRLPDDTRIAGAKTVADWTAMRGRLNDSPDTAIWTEAFENFFKARLESRYFEPIRAIAATEQVSGEGFAIVALHCSLIEFLAATLVGKSYKHRRHGPPGQFEYPDSGDMFIKFLQNNEPFKSVFTKAAAAWDFYDSVRCGLLHEARTKGRWRILVCESVPHAIDVDRKVIYRNKMQAAFDHFVAGYGHQLPMSADLQQAFIRKFESLCYE